MSNIPRIQINGTDSTNSNSLQTNNTIIPRTPSPRGSPRSSPRAKLQDNQDSQASVWKREVEQASDSIKKESIIILRIKDFLSLDAVANNSLITLKIGTVDELNALQNSLGNEEIPKFISKIQGLDFLEFSVNDQTSSLINILFKTIAKKMGSFPSLDNLVIGEIQDDVNIQLPNEFNRLENLIIANITLGAKLKLPDALNKLKYLCIGYIGKDASLILPSSLDALENLIIGCIAFGCNFKSPTSMLKLATLKIAIIEGIWSNHPEYIFYGLEKLPCLKKLIIQSMQAGSFFSLSHKLFPALTELSIQNIESTAVFQLTDQSDSLKSISIENVKAEAVLALGSSLVAHQSLSIKSIDQNVALVFNNSDQLESLLIDECNANLILPQNLNKLKVFSLCNTGQNFRILPPKTLPNLQKLTIVKPHENADLLYIPEKLDCLKKLYLDQFGEHVKFICPYYNNLQRCEFTNFHPNFTYKNFPTKIHFSSLNAKFDLSSIDGLSSVLTKLKFSNIGSEGNLEIPSTFNKLKTLKLGNLDKGAKILVAASLKSLKEVTYGQDNREIRERLPLIFLGLKLMFKSYPLLFISLISVCIIVFISVLRTSNVYAFAGFILFYIGIWLSL